jgi:CHAT domain-containing protein
MLLGPVRNRPEFKRILVVADGGLQYLPFGVLVSGSNSGAGAGEMQRLADNHEVINLPSMTALAAMRHRTHLNGAPSNGLLVFADPVFESDDPRIEPQIVDRRKGSSELDQARTSSLAGNRLPSSTNFPRLPSTRREAGVIAGVAPELSAKILLGFDANRLRATSPEMGTYRFIHFATHSVFDDEHPESSGIVLSLFDHDGKPQDGFIRLRDIYDLKLSADLVVLSACDTALGKDIKGEGITGITRGFMYAGAPRVVATLWNVDDEATSEFMKWFYAGILEKHEPPSASLREAQMEIRKQARWKSPYYWGAFIIEGD